MAQRQTPWVALFACTTALYVCAGMPCHATDSQVTPEQLRQLVEENRKLQEQLRRQQVLIESLSSKVKRIEENSSGHGLDTDSSRKEGAESAGTPPGPTFGKLNLSVEGGVAFFNTGSQGTFPNSEFRLDEAKLFIEAPVWNHVYFFSEINLATREESDRFLNLGECYLDFESVSALWNSDHLLNIRLGRLDIPFGEEYLTRDAIQNPLISHSLSDLWGVDEGIEFYGRLGPIRYALAVQNGGISDTQDFNPDKSIAGRIDYDPARWLHLSASGMRTGDLNQPRDRLSALWFGNGFFRSIGSGGVTKFHANLVEGDLAVWLPHGHLSTFGGYIHYDDNDPAGNNPRDVYYYSVEGVHDLIGKLYAGARFSQIFAPKGFPISANGDMGDYFFNPFALTKEIWRLSVGLGYRFSPNLLLKAEYSFERGQEQSGEKRQHEDLFALEAAFKF